jgi:hypothetical protein
MTYNITHILLRMDKLRLILFLILFLVIFPK